MTTKDFMSKAVNYYNKAYTAHQHTVITNTLDRIPDSLKADILLETINTFSIRFRTPPGVSEIMEAYETVKSKQQKQNNPNTCPNCGKVIYGDFCTNCDDYADTETEENQNLKELFRKGGSNGKS